LQATRVVETNNNLEHSDLANDSSLTESTSNRHVGNGGDVCNC